MRAAELVHAEAETPEPRGARRRLRPSLEIAIPAALLLAIACACFFGPLLYYALPEPVGGSVLDSNRPLFSPGHLLGTDSNGNDVLSRLLHGGRASLGIAVAVNLLGLAIGGLIGASSAQAGGVADSVIMRLMDVLIAFPSLVLVLAIAQGLGPSYTHTILALAFFSVPAFARMARAATLRLREQPFILAALLSGTRGLRLLVRHVAPNVLPQLATFTLLGMGIVMLIEGGLSFLGLGVPRPMPSWGNMIAQGQETLSVRPVLVLLPSAFLFVTVLAFNLLGEALRARWSSR